VPTEKESPQPYNGNDDYPERLSDDPLDTDDEEEPTEEEIHTLRHIAESLPVSCWLIAVVELCERFTYYGAQGLFQNYVQRPLDGSLGRGALGKSTSKKSSSEDD
jgi:hypothetical protein